MDLLPHVRNVAIALVSLLPSAPAQNPPANWSAQGNQPAAQFGSAVASAGDVNSDGYDDVIVGARNFGGDGRAFVYLGSQSGLAMTPTWSASGGQTGMAFGVSAGSAGDVNGDGYGDVIVGANNYTNGQANEGALFLYLGSGSGLSSSPASIIEGGKANGSFGFSTWGGFDVNQDGFDDVVVGAPGFNSNRGAAFLYCGSRTGYYGPCWSFEPATPTAKTGGAVSLGDFNGDGYPDVVVGAQYYDGAPSSSDDRGAVYVFFGSLFGLNPVPDWTFVGLQPGGGAGNAVAGAGDIDADGFDELIVAAQRFDEAGLPGAGRVYLFRGTPTGLQATPSWFLPGTQADALFGNSVASTGRFNDDLFADIVIGARYHDPSPGLVNAGAAFLFLGGASGPSASSTILGDQAGAELGFAVGSGGDVQLDGGSELLVGSWLYDSPETSEGLVQGFYGVPHTPVTYYVDVNAVPPGLGTVSQPFASIQYAIEREYVVTGDVIEVLPGTYKEYVNFMGKAIMVRALHGASMTTIQSPYAGPWPECYDSVVSFITHEGPSSVLEGFTITGGSGSVLGPPPFFWPAKYGGGVFAPNSAPTLKYCWIVNNVVTDNACHGSGGHAYGGGIYAGGPMKVQHCVISNNRVYDCCDGGTAAGGGVFGPAVLEECVLDGNSVNGDPDYSNGLPAYGGGAAQAILKNCTISNNTVQGDPLNWYEYAHAEGGGAYDCELTNCIIEGNRILAHSREDPGVIDRAYGGGAARCDVLKNCIVRGNSIIVQYPLPHSATMAGGGLSGCTATGCNIYDNNVDAGSGQGKSEGGGVASTSLKQSLVYTNIADFGGGCSDIVASQSTIWGNKARMLGGGVATPATLNSSIIWGNEPDEVHQGQGAPILMYCDVDDGSLAGGTNFKADPLFWSTLGPDLHLRPGSPCIDKGDPSLPPDPDGSRADVGALPFDPSYCGPTVNYCVAKTNSLGCVPHIFSTGTPSIASSNLRVQAEQVLNKKQGILFWGAVPANLSFQGSRLCVQPPITRTPVQNSGGSASGNDCTGTFSYQWTSAYMSSALLSPGVAVYCQYWYRDPADPYTTGLTDALEFVVCY
jgi:hypothetical protein